MSQLPNARSYSQTLDTSQGHPLAGFRGFRSGSTALSSADYRAIIRATRYYYRVDPIISTVVTRLAEIATTELRVSRELLRGYELSDEHFAFFRAVAKTLQPSIFHIILSYLIDGMAVPQYELTRMMGNRIVGNSGELGRTRYLVPSSIWVRDAMNIVLQPNVIGGEPLVFVQISQSDIHFVLSGGMYPDGTKDPKTFQLLTSQFPDYVKRIKAGETLFRLETPVIFRNLLPAYLYPQPYIEPALEALQRKHLMHRVDRAIAARTIEAFRHIKVGNDKFPADDQAIEATEQALQQSSDGVLFNLFTNHTVDISWIVPPFSELIDNKKYESVIQDIFFALGFPRILAVGETQRSNSADNQVAALGILSAIRHIHRDVLRWVEAVFRDVAEANGMVSIPQPLFAPVVTADVTQLLQYATNLLDRGVLSKDTVARLYGSDFEHEYNQQAREASFVPFAQSAPVMQSSQSIPIPSESAAE